MAIHGNANSRHLYPTIETDYVMDKKLTFRPNAVDEILTLLFVTILHEVDRQIDGFNLVD